MKRISPPFTKGRIYHAFLPALGVLALSIAASGTSQAQTAFYYTGGANNWDTTTTDWSTSSTGTPTTPFVSSNVSLARIGDVGAAGTLTLKAAISAQELDVDNLTGFTIAGTPALTLASGNINTNFLAGNTASSITTVISAPLGGTNINVAATGTAGSSTGFGNDTVTLSGANTFTGNLNLGAASSGPAGAGLNRVNITAASALPSTAAVNFLNTNTSFAVTGGTLTLPNNFSLNPNSTSYTPGAFMSYIGATSGFTLTANGTISGNGDVTISAGINGGAGLVVLNKANTYAGATVVANSTTGVLRLGITNGLPTTTALVFGDGSLSSATKGNTFGALDLNGQNQTVASLATNLAPVSGAVTTAGTANGITNTVSATTSVLTVSGSATTTYASTIGIPANVTNLTGASNNVALTLASTNTGTQILSGANTYTGGTTINGGKLIIAGAPTVSATGTGTVSIGAAGTLASAAGTPATAGTGTVSGLVTTAATTSVIAPGATAASNVGTVGALTLTKGLNIAAGATIPFDLGASASASDLITISGGTFTGGTAAGSVVFNFNTTQTSGAYDLISYAGATASGVDLSDFAATGANGTFSFNGSELDFSITSVPEPSTIVGGLLMVTILAYVQRRRLSRCFTIGFAR